MDFFEMQTRKKKIYFTRHFRCHLMPLKSTNKQLENYSDKKQKSQKPSKYAVSSSFLLAGDERIEKDINPLITQYFQAFQLFPVDYF